MATVKTIPFTKNDFGQFKDLDHGHNWPVVYLIEDGKELYIGETTNVHSRSNQHFTNDNRNKLLRIHVISDDEYNKSAILDTESLLIQYMFADGTFQLQNANKGISNHNYFDRQKYLSKIETIWNELKLKNLAKKDIVQLKNSDIFKYSPYKALTEDQFDVVSNLVEELSRQDGQTFLINGKPGTGKTILAIYLMKVLADDERTKHLKVGLVIPMGSLRSTIEKVFSKIKGLKRSMVIGPSSVVDSGTMSDSKPYDILIVDESHRLKRRRNIVNYRSHDTMNEKLGFGNEGTELDWILKSSKHQVLLYDANQSVRPSDIPEETFRNLDATRFELQTQIRVEGGQEYINFIENFFDLQVISFRYFGNYDFKVYDDLSEMVADLKQKDMEYGLSRLVAGYAWPWISKDDPKLFDIQIGKVSLKWNRTMKDWVNSPNAVNEVGCIHTVQGYDLNYVGVIIGPELSYDLEKRQFNINNDHYHDANGWRGITDPEELKRYIINIYKTLLTRGIKGCYIYCVDQGLNEYFKQIMH